MKFFIDTANIEEIKEAAALGILDGVTTNPSLVSKEGKDFRKLLDEILKIVDGPVSAEVISTDYEGMLKEGRDLAKIHKNIVVKIPLIKEGLKACKTLNKRRNKGKRYSLFFTNSGNIWQPKPVQLISVLLLEDLMISAQAVWI